MSKIAQREITAIQPGAVIMLEKPTSDDNIIVLARWHRGFVTWFVGDCGACAGHYFEGTFKGLRAALRNFKERE